MCAFRVSILTVGWTGAVPPASGLPCHLLTAPRYGAGLTMSTLLLWSLQCPLRVLAMLEAYQCFSPTAGVYSPRWMNSVVLRRAPSLTSWLWLDPSILPQEVAISDYSLLRRDPSRHGGGVSLYVRESLSCREPVLHPTLEFISTIVGTRVGSVLLGVFYCPPSAGSSLDELEALMVSLDGSASQTSWVNLTLTS